MERLETPEQRDNLEPLEIRVNLLWLCAILFQAELEAMLLQGAMPEMGGVEGMLELAVRGHCLVVHLVRLFLVDQGEMEGAQGA